jgi:hypothetical protein
VAFDIGPIPAATSTTLVFGTSGEPGRDALMGALLHIMAKPTAYSTSHRCCS